MVKRDPRAMTGLRVSRANGPQWSPDALKHPEWIFTPGERVWERDEWGERARGLLLLFKLLALKEVLLYFSCFPGFTREAWPQSCLVSFVQSVSGKY